MRYVLLLSLLLTGCLPGSNVTGVTPQVKFHFGQQVEVLTGFYAGATGTVSNYRNCLTGGDGEYIRDICYTIDFISEAHTLTQFEVSQGNLK